MLASIGVMKQLSAVHAIVFNTSRSVIVWGFSLAMSWQAFQSLQVVGFLSIVLGVLVFNDILISNHWAIWKLKVNCKAYSWFCFSDSMVRKCLWKKRISETCNSDLDVGSPEESIATAVEIQVKTDQQFHIHKDINLKW